MPPPTTLDLAHGTLRMPVFLPDGTRAVVRSVGTDDVEAAGIEGIVVNTLHLSKHPGASLVEAAGGVHDFMGWQRPVVSDSGGFQVYSLLAHDPKLGSIHRDGFHYKADRGGKKQLLSPESCIAKQFQIGADVAYCLDVCTHPKADRAKQEESVEFTIKWARECRDVWAARAERVGERAPRLFAVVQGGADPVLRRRCAEALVDIGFDGYGFGGWPIDDSTGGLEETVALVASLLPEEAPKHALGIGKPENVVAAWRAGYTIFDCAIVTRDARRGRLFRMNESVTTSTFGAGFYDYLYIGDERHTRSRGPIQDDCDCLACSRYSLGYIHHLFAIDEPLGHRLATIHNLRFYARMMARLRELER